MVRHAWYLIVVVAAGCKGEPRAPPLTESEMETVLAYLDDGRSEEPRRLIVDPDRAKLYDLVESALITKDLMWCAVDWRNRNPDVGRIDMILVAKVSRGTVSVALFFDKLDLGGGPTLDTKGTECAREQLGSRPFPGVDANVIGDADHALVGYRPGLRRDR